MKLWLLTLLAAPALGGRLREVKHWKTVDFHYPDEAKRQWALDSGALKIENNLPLGLEVWKDKIFVSVPRWKPGVASTLNFVKRDDEMSPLLNPYPSWEMNNVTSLADGTSNDTRVVNVFRMRVDACDRLWVVDCGLDDIWGEGRSLAPVKLLVFDLKTDKLLKQYIFDKDLIKDKSFFANIVVDSDPDKCDESYAYMPDLGSYGLVVYSWQKGEAWRVEHHYFHFDPVWGDYNIGGVNFQWTDGIFGVSLKKEIDKDHKTLFFHPLSSIREFSVNTEILKEKTSATNPENYHHFKMVGNRRERWQSTSSGLDEASGIMFYSLINQNAVGCWNSNKPYSPDTVDIVDSDNVTMVFPNDLIVDKEHNVWVLTDRLPLFLYRSLDTNDTNFRIMMASIEDAVKGTVCEVMHEKPEMRSETVPPTMAPTTTVGTTASTTTTAPSTPTTSTESTSTKEAEKMKVAEEPVTMISMKTSTSSEITKTAAA